jgi:hypothetical protein
MVDRTDVFLDAQMKIAERHAASFKHLMRALDGPTQVAVATTLLAMAIDTFPTEARPEAKRVAIQAIGELHV